MTTTNISLPDELQAFVDEQVVKGGYSTTSEYIRHLILQDQERTAKEQLEAMLIEGLDSGEAVEVNDEWWEQKRGNMVERLRQSQA